MPATRTTPLSRLGRRAAEVVAGLPAGPTDYEVVRDVPTPMSDGAVLLGDLYRPQGAGADAVVLIRTPYGRATLGSRLFGIVLARRGFTVLIQSVRGTFGSGGTFRPYTDEHRDGMDALAWVRAQPWCDGRVSTTGGSYFGHTQWAIAPYADPPLESASLHITAARISGLLFEHGAPGALNALSWSDTLARQELPASAVLAGRIGRRRRVVRALGTGPLRDADVVATGARAPFWPDFAAHSEPDDPFWSVADHDGADLTRMPPTNMVTGWWDLFLQLQLHDYAALRAAGVPARLTVGPWLHGAMPEVRELLRTDLELLEHRLRGGPAPAGPPVRVWLQQADEWLGFTTWPPPGIVTRQRFLDDADGLAPEPPQGASPPSAFTFDPEDPTRLEGGPLLSAPAMQVDDRDLEAGVDVAAFTGAPEPADLDLVGSVVAHLHVRPELAHADVVVRLCDVDEHDVPRNIVDGFRRLDPRTVPAPDVVVGPDGVLAVSVELFPTAYRVAAGHRLRLVVAGGAFPRVAPNPGVGGSLADDPAPRTCRFELFHDAAHPSHLALPIRGAGIGEPIETPR